MCKSSFLHHATKTKTIKIAGLSGSGKSTLIRAYTRKHPHVAAMSYGEFLARHGVRADDEWRRFLVGCRGLVLMDEHLEYGDDDLTETYVRERTAGIVFLDPPIGMLLERRCSDPTRVRDIDPVLASVESTKAKTRAESLSTKLALPLLFLHDTSVARSLSRLERFTTCVG